MADGTSETGRRREMLHYPCPETLLTPLSHVFCLSVQSSPFLSELCLPALDSSLVDCWQCYLLTLSSQTGFAHTQVICTHSVGSLKRSTVLVSLVTPINTERGGWGGGGLGFRDMNNVSV